jgi:hypothetical protein
VDYPAQFFKNNFMKNVGHLPGDWMAVVSYFFSRIETCEV